MKKALLGQEEVFLWKRQGQIGFWDFDIEEILNATNEDLEKDPTYKSPPRQVFSEIRDWILRYLEEGITDDLLDDLNRAMHEVRYTKYVLPFDLLPSESGFPRNGYMAELEPLPKAEAYAADEFSKILTSGMLSRVKHCQMEGCERLFEGPPQAKWCSKTCGSKYRVREKRRRDSS